MDGCGESMGRKLEEKVQNLKEKIRKYETKHCQFRATTRNTFFVFSYFFSFAKQSKLGETVTCFVQFRISRNLKYETVNPHASKFGFLNKTGLKIEVTFGR